MFRLYTCLLPPAPSCHTTPHPSGATARVCPTAMPRCRFPATYLYLPSATLLSYCRRRKAVPYRHGRVCGSAAHLFMRACGGCVCGAHALGGRRLFGCCFTCRVAQRYFLRSSQHSANALHRMVCSVTGWLHPLRMLRRGTLSIIHLALLLPAALPMAQPPGRLRHNISILNRRLCVARQRRCWAGATGELSGWLVWFIKATWTSVPRALTPLWCAPSGIWCHCLCGCRSTILHSGGCTRRCGLGILQRWTHAVAWKDEFSTPLRTCMAAAFRHCWLRTG